MHARCRGAAPEKKLSLLKSWGGATIAYRRRMVDSPSYTLNHEEVEKALEEGIVFAEGLTPGAHRGRRVRACQGGAVPGRDPPAGEVRPDRRRHPAQHRARARGRREPRARRQVLPRLRRERRAGEARAPHLQAGARRGAAASVSRRALHELLRRPAPLLLRQRGESDGQREAGISGGQQGPGAAQSRLRPARCASSCRS